MLLFLPKRGRGINIEVMPGSAKLFNEVRSKDINLENGFSEEESIIIYYSLIKL